MKNRPACARPRDEQHWPPRPFGLGPRRGDRKLDNIGAERGQRQHRMQLEPLRRRLDLRNRVRSKHRRRRRGRRRLALRRRAGCRHHGIRHQTHLRQTRFRQASRRRPRHLRRKFTRLSTDRLDYAESRTWANLKCIVASTNDDRRAVLTLVPDGSDHRASQQGHHKSSLTVFSDARSDLNLRLLSQAQRSADTKAYSSCASSTRRNLITVYQAVLFARFLPTH